MQCAASTTTETRPVEENARAVDDPRARPARAAENATCLRFGVVLEAHRVERRAESADQASLVLVLEFSPYGAAPLAKLGRRLGQDTKAPAAPNARPV